MSCEVDETEYTSLVASQMLYRWIQKAYVLFDDYDRLSLERFQLNTSQYRTLLLFEAVTVLSQEGFPSAGVWRVRDVMQEAEQWRIGGGTGSNLDTRILDLLWPEGREGTQEDLLSNPSPEEEVEFEDLTAGDYPQVPMIRP
jgi:hypothetical protein